MTVNSDNQSQGSMIKFNIAMYVSMIVGISVDVVILMMSFEYYLVPDSDLILGLIIFYVFTYGLRFAYADLATRKILADSTKLSKYKFDRYPLLHVLDMVASALVLIALISVCNRNYCDYNYCAINGTRF